MEGYVRVGMEFREDGVDQAAILDPRSNKIQIPLHFFSLDILILHQFDQNGFPADNHQQILQIQDTSSRTRTT
jgi:hypothetical protein